MKQSEAFLRSEGDGFYRRNAAGLARMESYGSTDPVLRALDSLGLRPKRALEVGCSNGWRLKLLHAASGAECFGIDPSAEAVLQARAFISLRTAKLDPVAFHAAAQ